MKNNEIKSGDNVCYYHGYYTHGCGVNEYGDPEIIDVHEEIHAKVLIVVGDRALCVCYNYADNEHARIDRLFVNELHTSWLPLDKLHTEENKEKELLFERPPTKTLQQFYEEDMQENNYPEENPELPF